MSASNKCIKFIPALWASTNIYFYLVSWVEAKISETLHFQGDWMMVEGDVRLTKYVFIFSGCYLGFMIVANILASGFNIDFGSGVNIAILFGAGYSSAVKFVTDLKRAPSNKEKRLLSLSCMLASFVISILFATIIFNLIMDGFSTAELGELFRTLPVLVWVALILVVGGLHYLVLGLVFGWGARKYAAKYIAD